MELSCCSFLPVTYLSWIFPWCFTVRRHFLDHRSGVLTPESIIFAVEWGYALPQRTCEMTFKVFSCEQALQYFNQYAYSLIMAAIRDVHDWPMFCNTCVLAVTLSAFFWFIFLVMLTLRTWAVCGKSRLSTYGLFGAFGLTMTANAILTEFSWKVLTCKYILSCLLV